MKNITTILKNLVFPSLGGARGGCRGMVCHIFFILSFFHSFILSAQTIGGNVYGGGNKGNVDGKTTVTVKGGTIEKVFAGARMANVGGRAFVHVDGKNATGDVFITELFGGNDISGTIGTSKYLPKELTDTLSAAERAQIAAGTKTRDDFRDKNDIDDSWNAFVRVTRNTTLDEDDNEVEERAIIIGSVFGGGNGDYTYRAPGTESSTHDILDEAGNVIASSTTGFSRPELSKTYLEIKGGCITYVYGGGNNATITENTTISMANESEGLDKMLDRYANVMYAQDNSLTIEQWRAYTLQYLIDAVKINTFQADLSDLDFNSARVFGGNNKADMKINPTWNLQKGRIRDLYSGGNEGRMTSPDGILLDINPLAANNNLLKIMNVYGGCRRADVRPQDKYGVDMVANSMPGYKFPSGMSARTLVRGGKITNVYGGNDITGTVYGGNAVGIYTSIAGDVYGSGNGSYAYTDNSDLATKRLYKDFYYNPGTNSAESLDLFRPHAEQVSIRLYSPDENKPTIIGGSVYCGGNSASLNSTKKTPRVELKIGNNVIADRVFLGNNGEKMIDPYILELYAKEVDERGNIVDSGIRYKYSTLDLTDTNDFADYMESVAMKLHPEIVFDQIANNDPADYVDNSSKIGSLFCGGNVGSMAIPGKNTYTLNKGLIIYDKLVAGCNNANIAAGTFNAAYNGGVLGSKEERADYTDASGNIKDRITLNLERMTIEPMRWNDVFEPVGVWDLTDGHLKAGETYYTSDLRSTAFTAVGTEVPDAGHVYYKMTAKGTALEWNTARWDEESLKYMATGTGSAVDTEYDKARRLLGGNVYGGCYNSGHVNGNITINMNEPVIDKEKVFAVSSDGNTITGTRNSGVIVDNQIPDVTAITMSIFGGGYGEDTEIWGSATVNANNGYMFQIFGGGEKGIIGKKGEGYNAAYSTYVSLNGINAGYSEKESGAALAEVDNIYAGGNQGDVLGDTHLYLGNGRVYDAFGGACDADIWGHTEVYIGRQKKVNGSIEDGFPWVRHNVYGGNDFDGMVKGSATFDGKLRTPGLKASIYNPNSAEIPAVLTASTYVEYHQGRVNSIFGAGEGNYDYTQNVYKINNGADSSSPQQESSFVNLMPNTFSNRQNAITSVFGGSHGYKGFRDSDTHQDRSYVLVDIPDNIDNFTATEVFGSGNYNGLGMKGKVFDGALLDQHTAVVDLIHGQIAAAYGGSYNEGVTRRTMLNVPANSTIKLNNIFGGAYGTQILPPCDVYESNVNYNSDKAVVKGAIFGGNNNERRTLFTKVNISAPVYNGSKDPDTGVLYTGEVFGAGRGIDTWAEHTEVNMLSGGRAYNVYGGGQMGHVLNASSVEAYMNLYKDKPSPQISNQDPYWRALKEKGELWEVEGETIRPEHEARWAKDWIDAWSLGEYYNPDGNWNKYAQNEATSLRHVSDRDELDDKTAAQLDDHKKHNTNVIINKGAVVDGYAYGGGLGDASVHLSGDVYGTTYIAVLGGEVKKDVYAGGRAGSVDNLFGAETFDISENKFIATANAYIKGGTARNVYGGGYEGNVGHHDGDITMSFEGDRPARSYVVIGNKDNDTFTGGAPAILRNVYGGGEGGSLYGNTRVTMNNGYIGYRYMNTGTAESPVDTYEEELNDRSTNDIEMAGNIFGGGYVVNSYVDNSIIDMYGGQVRGSLYGGGEVGPIGRGAQRTGMDRGIENQDATLFRAGTTQVNLYDGKVLRNVFGGGRGKDSWGGDGTMYMNPDIVSSLKANGLFCKGYVFGQTRVNIFGGEIGTAEGMAYGYGNVFGGCDEGTVYSGYHEYYTQTEIDAAEEGDDAYGKTTEDIKNGLYIGKKAGVRYNKGLAPGDPDYDYNGYYFQYDGTNFLNSNSGQRIFTEDCKVLVEPHTRALEDVTVNSHNYKAGEYVTTEDLNTMKDKNTDAGRWSKLDPFGIIIHNAVFAGGNIASGSSSVFANATTVYGNATASIHDIYNRDLITIGTGHTGGLYGDGNLTFVDGYRELNITNYGTDYYHITKQLPYSEYELLPDREKAYYELKYKVKDTHESVTDNSGSTYTKGSTLPEDEILVLFEGTDRLLNGKPNPEYWQENGVVTTYAGRIMNTIQRADFCGVFGSRMVMKGAQDRVPEEADYTNYTINRVREVSLNKMETPAGDTGDNALHGNYFGIYSIVNYLGALTSDVDFHDTPRTTDTKDAQAKGLAADGVTTFAQWKAANIANKKRNNGTCYNKLALASGVYLELTTEESTGNTLETKAWGPITGVVELDLINVQPGIGGGFVYAKNEHGIASKSSIVTKTLTALNEHAASKWDYIYDPNLSSEDSQLQWETSGNFIHGSQTIIDDCYNISNRYREPNRVPAHYWYISGSVYVYDQYISAYTGAPNAYSETAEIPITISAASNGTLTLMDVQPNYYAYYKTANTPLTGEQKLVINDVSYQLNQPISYWDWYKLPAKEKALFVRDTYVVTEDCKINNTAYTAGTVLLKSRYDALVGKDDQGNPIYPANVTHKREIDGEEKDVAVAFTEVVRSSNNLSHNTGYLLTYNVTNPSIWDTWYTKVDNNSSREKNQTDGAGWEDGPTYHPTVTGLYGQQEYGVNAIISKTDYDKYEGYDADGNGSYKDIASGDVYGLKQMYPSISSREDQAEFVPAHIITKEYSQDEKHYYPGAPVHEAIAGFTAPAFVSTATLQLSATEYIYVNDLMTEAEKNAYITAHPDLEKDINKLIIPAYICSEGGLYGGSYYNTDNNYRALEAYSALSPEDRKKFAFNYDALDLLIDPAYGGKQGQKYQYDGKEYNHEVTDADKTSMIYSLTKPIDYTATYNSNTPLSLTTGVSVKRYNSTTEKYETSSGVTTLQKDDELLSTEYEKLPNEQRHYAAIHVDLGGGTYYVVHTGFVHGETPYAVGTTIASEAFERLNSDEKKDYIDILTFTAEEVTSNGTDGAGNPRPFYYCRESYEVNKNGEGVAVTDFKDNTQTYTSGSTVPMSTVISANDYSNLPNKQQDFTIHGVSPMETSTLYVARNADIRDLSTEKIITVIYKYDYEESDESGQNIIPVSERHIVNIHINFKSGVPTVEDINPPTIVLPGTGITMRVPSVTPGAYEVTGGGWEIFEKPSDAESHINGMEYTPSVDPLYWYQDGFYLAYYAKTYLGKTYSNHVPVSVANYHDLKRIMDDKEKHLYVDYDRTRLKRDSKIYINDYSASSQNGLQLFKDFYNLSLLHTGTPEDSHFVTTDAKGLISSGPFTGHKPLNNSTDVVDMPDGSHLTRGVMGGTNLEFFLRTDISHADDPAVPDEWTSIANEEDPCFNGVLHGDGHTISGLDNSLFGKLCGSVYNLGVTGSFTGAGVAEQGEGYVESCWIKTSGEPNGKVRAVFGTPNATTGYRQIVNSYCQTEKNYSTDDDGNHGLATPMPEKAFYNGTLAYDLNNFYLYKRYNDQKTGSGLSYNYWKSGEDEPQTGFYANHADLCSSGYNNIMYVEERFADGDFRYAAGEIPTESDRRLKVEVKTETNGETKLIDHFYPIWPDDYIFFGQKLTYGYSATQAHQSVPTAVRRDGGRIDMTERTNRVYRAPAYYRSKEMGATHFNPDAYLAFKSEDGTQYVSEKMMTAIDFRGHYDSHPAYGTYGLADETGLFYTPLLDDDGLTSIRNCDVTRNLLVYAPKESNGEGEKDYINKNTHDVLTDYFVNPDYDNYYDNSAGYRLVGAPAEFVYGHLVQHNLKATDDHLLIDKQDFNCPIAYSFDSDHLMWYQRIPEDNEYVDRTKGWQGISIPFTAELVTTSEKGEITHFYDKSDVSKNGTGTKIGHEYWLRELEGITASGVPEVKTANMLYPALPDDESEIMNKKSVTNTYLWNYYYQDTDRKDRNSDIYQKYYSKERTYNDYPLLTASKPYIIGFPGKTYFEFDLSGTFEPLNTYSVIERLNKQIITFASVNAVTINVSDDEILNAKKLATKNGYTFVPSYMSSSIDAGEDAYTLSAAGDSYDKVPETGAATTVDAFRPYFAAVPAAPTKEFKGVRSIRFSNTGTGELNPGNDTDEEENGSLDIFVKGRKIHTVSHLDKDTDIRIVNASGATITTFTLEPGKTVITPITNPGTYIVNKKKVFVK